MRSGCPALPTAGTRGRRQAHSYNLPVSSQPRAPAAAAFVPAASVSGAVSLMAADMHEVDAVIQRRLASDVALINQIAHYIISAGGKRIRPMLVLLFSKALGLAGMRPYTSRRERDTGRPYRPWSRLDSTPIFLTRFTRK